MNSISTSEKVFVYVFMLVNLSVPPLALEFYPFTTVPLFPSAPQFYCRYDITDLDGKPYHLLRFDLHRSDWGGRRDWPSGLQYHYGFNRFGVVPTQEELTVHLQEALRHSPGLPGLRVTQYVYGKKGRGVGEIQTQMFRVENIYHRPARESSS
jgi:hypothetical protein